MWMCDKSKKFVLITFYESDVNLWIRLMDDRRFHNSNASFNMRVDESIWEYVVETSKTGISKLFWSKKDQK